MLVYNVMDLRTGEVCDYVVCNDCERYFNEMLEKEENSLITGIESYYAPVLIKNRMWCCVCKNTKLGQKEKNLKEEDQ